MQNSFFFFGYENRSTIVGSISRNDAENLIKIRKIFCLTFVYAHLSRFKWEFSWKFLEEVGWVIEGKRFKATNVPFVKC